jgi:hypothetical protein
LPRDDRILPITKIISAIIAPVLVLAVVLLYFLPGDTDRHWAWTIRPELTAMFMGAGYASGAYYFTRAVFGSSWRAVGVGLVPITGFTIFMLLATVLHWDRFDHGHVAFWLWTFLYVVTPVIVPALWLTNRRTDPGPVAGELRTPVAIRAVLAAAGFLLVVLAIVMMVAPSVVIEDWLWPLSELTARVVAAFILLTGGLLLMVGNDGRWTASRIHIETFLIGTVLMVIAIVRDWGSLQDNEVVRWGYLLSVIVAGGLLLGLYLWMETRGRSVARPAAAET